VEEKGAGVVGTLEVASNNAYLPASEEGTEVRPAVIKGGVRKVLATPVARAMARDMNIDINLVTGTGPAGRIMKSDIQGFHGVAATVKLFLLPRLPRLQQENLSVVPMTRCGNQSPKTCSGQNRARHMTLFDEPEVSASCRQNEI
jgi:pyruvate dehydrogenase E2 component (dihydrolipoamide acetyltransferase)